MKAGLTIQTLRQLNNDRNFSCTLSGRRPTGAGRFRSVEADVLQDGVLWFLLADGRRARVLAEQRRGVALHEFDAWKLVIGEAEIFEPQDRPPRSHDRFGPGRHAMDGGRNLHELEENKFLERVANLLAEAAQQRQFAHLVIAAPPRALGILRDLLPEPVRACVRAELDKDIVDEEIPTLRLRLTELLRGQGV